MTIITLQDNIKLSKTEFSSIYELRFFIYENFWYPEIRDEIEESWYKNWNLDFDDKKYTNLDELLFDLKN